MALPRVDRGPRRVELDLPGTDDETVPDRPWIVLVWNDPINLMSYVTFVLQKVFGYAKEKAEKMMWDVHTKGRAVVSNGTSVTVARAPDCPGCPHNDSMSHWWAT